MSKVNEPVRPYINVSQLEFILNKENNSNENRDYHDFFMKNYHKIFMPDAAPSPAKQLKEKKPVLAIEEKKTALADQRHVIEMSDCDDDLDDENNAKKVDVASSHDIGLHIKQLRNKSMIKMEMAELDPDKVIRRLRKLLRKL